MIRFGQTWTDWAFRIAASIILAVAAIGVIRSPRGHSRSLVFIALVLLFLNEFLKIVDMAYSEQYEADFAIVRHTLYLGALPILAFAYIRDQASSLGDLLHTLEDRVRDRTVELESSNTALRELSATDGLTQIANRAEFDRCYAEIWDRAIATQKPVTVAVIDVDQFKNINDQHGLKLLPSLSARSRPNRSLFEGFRPRLVSASERPQRSRSLSTPVPSYFVWRTAPCTTTNACDRRTARAKSTP